MKFKTLCDHDSEMLQLSGPYTDCDWPIYYAIRLAYLDDCVSEKELKEMGGRYCVSLLIVSPDACPIENRQSALRSCGQGSKRNPITKQWENCTSEEMTETWNG